MLQGTFKDCLSQNMNACFKLTHGNEHFYISILLDLRFKLLFIYLFLFFYKAEKLFQVKISTNTAYNSYLILNQWNSWNWNKWILNVAETSKSIHNGPKTIVWIASCRFQLLTITKQLTNSSPYKWWETVILINHS